MRMTRRCRHSQQRRSSSACPQQRSRDPMWTSCGGAGRLAIGGSLWSRLGSTNGSCTRIRSGARTLQRRPTCLRVPTGGRRRTAEHLRVRLFAPDVPDGCGLEAAVGDDRSKLLISCGAAVLTTVQLPYAVGSYVDVQRGHAQSVFVAECLVDLPEELAPAEEPVEWTPKSEGSTPAAVALRRRRMQQDWELNGSRWTEVRHVGHYDWSAHAHPELTAHGEARNEVPARVEVSIFLPEVEASSQALLQWKGAERVHVRLRESGCHEPLAKLALGYPVDKQSLVQRFVKRARVLNLTAAVALPELSEGRKRRESDDPVTVTVSGRYDWAANPRVDSGLYGGPHAVPRAVHVHVQHDGPEPSAELNEARDLLTLTAAATVVAAVPLPFPTSLESMKVKVKRRSVRVSLDVQLPVTPQSVQTPVSGKLLLADMLQENEVQSPGAAVLSSLLSEL
eukprot:TRINITY_DN17897_c0_g1_i1.p1 TRINITY_DN17897_c0_g1~~TRINITY_DN17897_c0_g1_i1.p1  ORF type:complete len:451 (+),score=110.19 TRINITY_DN17897_c0_g1_i1:200-1552(+)